MQGFDRLVTELRAVYTRHSLKRRGPHNLRFERDQVQPIFACVQDPLAIAPPGRQGVPQLPAVLARLSEHLKPDGDVGTQVPHAAVALVRSPPEGPDAALPEVSADEFGELLTLLDQAVAKFQDHHAGDYRFPRYSLVRWLMRQSFEADTPSRRAQLRLALYGRAVRRDNSTSDVDQFVSKLQDRLPLPLFVLSYKLLPAFCWLRQSGRVPGLGGPYRWLRGQSYVPRGDGGLFDLALRLTEGHWQDQTPQSLAGLLVHAFLEDLRAGFRRVAWFGRYRATHPILMVGPISRKNGGYLLVRMVATVRNDTQRFDPLLLITAGQKVPPLAVEPETAPTETVEQWRKRQELESLRRQIDAWLLVAQIEPPAAAVSQVAPPRRPRPVPRPRWLRWLGWSERPVPVVVPQDAKTLEPLQPVHGPAWRRPLGAWLIRGLVLTLLAGSYVGVGVLDSLRHCGSDTFSLPPFDSPTHSVAKVDGDCVGITDGTNANLFPSQSFAPVRSKILEQNKRAEQLHKEQPERPLATLIFMASADDRSLDAGVFTAEREQLAGLAVAQAVQLNKPQQRYEPILRVLIANAGPRFRHADRVADQIGRLVAEDPTIVAVVGMAESRSTTEDMVRRLAAVGLPTIAATLTADSMVDVSRMYLQVSPQNRREAAVAAAHLRNLLTIGKDPFGRPLERHATVYKSDDPTDTYSQNLARDLQLELTAAGVPVLVKSFSPSGDGMDGNQSGRDACDRGGIVLFTGRGQVDFESFLGGIQDRCRANPPYILAGDDVTKWVADRTTSAHNQSIPFQYLALATAPDLLAGAPPEASDFYARLADLFQYESTDRGRSLDGHAALSYDAAYSVVLAVSYLRRDSIAVNGGTVWSALQSITDAGGAQRGYQGVTGRIDFGGSVLRRVPVNKPVAIVTFRNGRPDPRATLVCGGRTGSPSWCPVDQVPAG